jgi:sortase B
MVSDYNVSGENVKGRAVMRVDRKNRTEPQAMPRAGSLPQKGPVNLNNYHIQGYCPVPETKPKRRNRTLFIILITVLAAVFVYASAQLILYLAQSRQAMKEERMIQTMIADNEAGPAPEETAVAAAEPTAEPAAASVTQKPAPERSTAQAEKPDVLIQFQKALEINPDTVGQLQMGESIRAYVVQRDNSYYLRHSFSGEYSFSGAIFLDVSCSINPQSRNLILHGHNMKDGTAFGKLPRFDTISYLNKYPFIEFSTLYESARYIPFAAVYYSIDTKSDRYLDIYRINAMSDQEFAQFVTRLQTMSEYLLPVYVAGTDKILTVTTCAGGGDDDRFAVFAVKRNGI